MKIELIKELVDEGIISPEYMEYIEQNGVKPPVQEDEVENGVSTPIKFDSEGSILVPPVKPKRPKTENWKRMTPKRVMILTNYRMKLAEYNSAKREYDSIAPPTTPKIELIREFLSRPRIERDMKVYEYPCGKWHKGLGTNLRVEIIDPEIIEANKAYMDELRAKQKPEPRDEEHLGSWMGKIPMPKFERRHYKRNRDVFGVLAQTEQMTLFSKRYVHIESSRVVTHEILESFKDAPDKELANEYLDALLRGSVPCLHGSVDIRAEYIMLTQPQRDEINRRLKVNGDW